MTTTTDSTVVRGHERARGSRHVEPRVIVRYPPDQRANHWITVIAFFLLATSGLAFFHPAFFPLVVFLGGPQWARILHPWVGVAMFVSFMILAFRLWRDNIWGQGDTQWMKQIGDVVMNHDDRLPAIGKYNPGQKLLFWVLLGAMTLLLLTGIVIWRSIFGVYFSVPIHRVAVLLHSISAFVLIASIFVHIYAAIWVKGSIRAMTRGTVSHAWAHHHHPLWFRRMIGRDEVHPADRDRPV